MKKDKVKVKSENEFIQYVANDCIVNMTDEDKEYIRDGLW